ncbi:MAG: hypothetical protein NUW37_00500 [Planctomycetes bacterium]|nr:hypothetical protein [Planctomycetota bacterium]
MSFDREENTSGEIPPRREESAGNEAAKSGDDAAEPRRDSLESSPVQEPAAGSGRKRAELIEEDLVHHVNEISDAPATPIDDAEFVTIPLKCVTALGERWDLLLYEDHLLLDDRVAANSPIRIDRDELSKYVRLFNSVMKQDTIEILDPINLTFRTSPAAFEYLAKWSGLRVVNFIDAKTYVLRRSASYMFIGTFIAVMGLLATAGAEKDYLLIALGAFLFAIGLGGKLVPHRGWCLVDAGWEAAMLFYFLPSAMKGDGWAMFICIVFFFFVPSSIFRFIRFGELERRM